MTELEYLKKYYDGDIKEALNRLKKGEPVQYIVGNVDFYGYQFEVNKNVLIPRFETEELVEKTIKRCKKKFDCDMDIVDIGTGSGCIAITLKKEFSNSRIDAVDISSSALEVAINNANKNHVNIHFIKGNLLDPLEKKYDVLISNPPYIDKKEDIMDIVKNNEPKIALYAEHQGLFCYEEILKESKKVMKEKCLLAFEIGAKQGDYLKMCAKMYFPNATIIVEKDLQGRDRFLFIDCE